jgi:LysM repeat protein
VSDVYISAIGGRTVGFGLAGDATLSQTGGTAWTTVDRPRQKGFAEFTAVQLSQMVLPLILDHDDGTDVEGEVSVLDSWRLPASAGGTPPALTLDGPLPTALGVGSWVVQTIGWGEAQRRRDGRRTQQALSLTLLEFGQTRDGTSDESAAQAALKAALIAAILRSVRGPYGYHPLVPQAAAVQVQAVQAQPQAAEARTYTVSSGDTLWAIAANEYGEPTRWTEIANRNGIRDPRQLQIGTVLVIP